MPTAQRLYLLARRKVLHADQAGFLFRASTVPRTRWYRVNLCLRVTAANVTRLGLHLHELLIAHGI